MNRGVRQLRIVGGSLRGRKISFPEEPGLRPTPDRVRETLFNWLAPHVQGTRVLDLFAGSGALGFEALSRGAAEATLVDASRVVCARLRETATGLGLGQARVEVADAVEFLRRSTTAWDLIFIDPPFGENLVPLVLKSISERLLLAPGGFCYVELPQGHPLPPLPVDWALHREGKAGEVGYHLLHETRRDLPRHL
jgi:16S rRNA (guanine966-N2)-methyltransferase